ncbi:MAG: TonB-dependent receptor, partial [Myxococcales bacterium]|nr:TonB-dependent receptor [Myxococcales bacterium]
MSVSRILLRCALPLAVLVAGAATLTAAPRTASADESMGAIKGVVTNTATGQPMTEMNVVLLCSCLQGDRFTVTNGAGVFLFDHLPPGKYTVQVLDPNKEKPVKTTLDLARGQSRRADFAYDPELDTRVITVVAPTQTGGGYKEEISGDVMPYLPTPGRDMTDVVDVAAPTAGNDGAGVTIMGSDASENNWSVDGASVTDPRFGTVGSSIVQDFLDTVEVQEAGYDAEFGGASGGQIRARRISGSNKLRGAAIIRYSPRLASPRLISATDEAIRSAVVTDHEMQAVVQVNGPIIENKLFFAAGVSPQGNVNSLIQSYYHRVDKDRSGGYADCPYKNGDFDCAEGGNYIQSEKFAEKRFKTGRMDVGWFGRLDWVITPKHRLYLSGGGGPSFDRTTYRLPASSVPNTFGSNPETALGGSARIATGIVDKHFGWTLGDATQVGLNYEGRVAQDKVEIDAGVSFFQATYEEAWRLDNPEQKLRTLTQESDNQGRNLYEFLDRDGAVNSVNGAEAKCNNSDLPGLACPTRFWLSGGLGQYNQEVSRRVTGQLNLTHFFDVARTAHQFKYGTIVEHLERKTVSTYSGSNADDFYSNCATSQEDGAGGEFCYDPASNSYDIDFGSRVNNNRLVLVNTDNPNQRTTLGYGRVRREQDDL